jgi:hypothetical protein
MPNGAIHAKQGINAKFTTRVSQRTNMQDTIHFFTQTMG